MKKLISYIIIFCFVFNGIGICLSPISHFDSTNSDPTYEEFSWLTRNRLIKELKKDKDKVWDVFVIGGGIVGTSVARDAASRGLKAIVVDQGDWGSGASRESTKVIHRGVLYLERSWEYLKKSGRGIIKRSIYEITSNLAMAVNNFRLARTLLKNSETVYNQSPQITKLKRVYMVIDKADNRSPITVYIGLLLH